MPKLKSVIAGLALSTALTGGVVSLGAATTTASADAATTQITAGKSVLAGHGCGWRPRRCGWGWGWKRWKKWNHRRHHGIGRIRIVIINKNHNDNRSDRRW
ncbi:hypothetical protein [Nonomuraea sp. NPDC049309]|uniref:hypothetical protein n=1 Tax=Nonomuraea sp. NPDC049309 TaxID=3364350 RepID=UPI003715365C